MKRFESGRSRAVLISCLVLAGCSFNAPPSNLVFTPERLDFGEVSNCATVKRTFALQSQRGGALTIEVPSHDGFIVTPSGPQELAAFGSVEFEVAFTGDEAARNIVTQLTVLVVDGGALEIIDVTASTPGQTREEENIDFLGVGVNGSYTLDTNTDVSTFEPGTEPAFTATKKTAVEYALKFAPTEARAYSTTLRGMRVGRCPLSLNLRGDGVTQRLTWNPTSVLFSGTVNQSLTQTVTFSNYGKRVGIQDFTFVGSTAFDVQQTLTVSDATRGTDGRITPSTADLPIAHRPTSAGTRLARLTATTPLDEQPTIDIPVRSDINP